MLHDTLYSYLEEIESAVYALEEVMLIYTRRKYLLRNG